MMAVAAFSRLPDRAALTERWRALERRSDGGFFLGWTWTGSWLEATGATPELLAVTQGASDVALALVGRSIAPRLLGRAATLWLNQSGDPAMDRAFVEYNGLLCAAGDGDAAARAAMAAIERRKDWRVLRLSGVTPRSPLLDHGRFRRRVRGDVSPAYYIDLAAVRTAGGDYLSLLSSNTRGQIRRSARDYGAAAPDIARAADPAQIDLWLAEMAALNAGRHADNAWDDPLFRRFARTIVRNGMDSGEVELLRITCGDTLLGLLINFVYRGRAMNYQSAFAPPPAPKGKPGLMCHAAAVERYARAGHAIYSLLAGKDRYKQSLATGEETLEWWTLERFAPRLEAEALARRLLKRPASA